MRILRVIKLPNISECVHITSTFFEFLWTIRNDNK
nr:MAG TPA: hypothetical protein [Caudoviricetes sp.]